MMVRTCRLSHPAQNCSPQPLSWPAHAALGALSGLILLGLLLFVLTFFVLAAARLMLMRLEKKAGN